MHANENIGRLEGLDGTALHAKMLKYAYIFLSHDNGQISKEHTRKVDIPLTSIQHIDSLQMDTVK